MTQNADLWKLELTDPLVEDIICLGQTIWEAGGKWDSRYILILRFITNSEMLRKQEQKTILDAYKRGSLVGDV